MALWEGTLKKMRVRHETPVAYELVDAFDKERHPLALNDLLGKRIRLKASGSIRCIHCGQPTRKSFGEGSCYDCFRRLPQNDICILKPELCHFHKEDDPCRDPEWGRNHCFQPHFLYVALSSGAKVGITRQVNIPTRWMDQGAHAAIPVARVADRFTVGKLEHHLAQSFSDRTQWQRMLKNLRPEIDLEAQVETVIADFPEEYREAILDERPLYTFDYPSLRWPEKVKSINLEKVSVAEGELIALKGQYLLLDSGVVNIRKHSGFQAALEVL